MDRTNTEVFSPIANLDEENIKRRSDSFSKFLKGPGVFKKNSVNSESLENVDENIPVKKHSSGNSVKTSQKKAGKSETSKNKVALPSCETKHNIAFTKSPKVSRSLKEDKSANVLFLTPKKSKDFSNNFVTKRNKSRRNHEDESECSTKEECHSRASEAPSASGSKEIKKTEESNLTNQHNPLSQVQSGILEKVINEAVESQVDGIKQLLWSHYSNLLKTIYILKDDMEQKHASETTTMFKIIEELLEENRLLRNAIFARQ